MFLPATECFYTVISNNVGVGQGPYTGADCGCSETQLTPPSPAILLSTRCIQCDAGLLVAHNFEQKVNFEQAHAALNKL